MKLYELVLENVDGQEEPLSNDHCSKISMMNGEASENIYLLIFHHFAINNKGKKQLLMNGIEYPYGGKPASKDGRGINFKLSTLPYDLQQIIVRYLKMIST